MDKSWNKAVPESLRPKLSFDVIKQTLHVQWKGTYYSDWKKKPKLLKAYSIKHNWRDTVGNILWNFPRDTDPFKFIFNLMHFVQNTVKMKSMNAILASSRFLPHPFLQNSWLSLLSSYLQNAVPIILWRLTKLSKKKFTKGAPRLPALEANMPSLGLFFQQQGQRAEFRL